MTKRRVRKARKEFTLRPIAIGPLRTLRLKKEAPLAVKLKKQL